MEVELKLLLDPADNHKLSQHPLIAAHARGQVRHARLVAHYFDSPDLHLLHHGAGLRVRRMDGVWIQTMKAGGSVQNGLHQRNEWEGPVARPWPQLGKLRKLMTGHAEWQAVLDAPGLKDRLAALFSVQVERSTWDLDVDGNLIELVLDVGNIERHGQQLPVNEIELELKQGEPAVLFTFALQLLDQLPLRLSNSNKAERGYALCFQTGTVAVKASPLALAPDASVAAALRAVLDNCLQQIQRNQAAVIAGDNAESLHQMRVGIRRLRSALKLFAGAAPCPPALRDDIDWLGSELGAARDWDVLAEATLARIAGKLGKEMLVLQALVQEQVRGHHQAAAQALQSQRYTRWQLACGAWLQHLASGPGQALEQAASGYAQHTLQRLHKSLLRSADRIADGSPASLHRLRIAAKRSRYALEFFQSLYRHGSTQRYLGSLSALQDQLGAHNDLVVADRLLQELQQQHPQAAAALGYVRGYLQAQQERHSTDVAAVRKGLHALHLPQRA